MVGEPNLRSSSDSRRNSSGEDSVSATAVSLLACRRVRSTSLLTGWGMNGDDRIFGLRPRFTSLVEGLRLVRLRLKLWVESHPLLSPVAKRFGPCEDHVCDDWFFYSKTTSKSFY
jgi:hypothetical protein